MIQRLHNSKPEIPTSGLRSPISPRSGISIIEVMTAVVVAMIGVFGTLVLIPFAVRQAQSGLDLDDSRNLALNSVATFDAMGFDDPNQWVVGFAKTNMADVTSRVQSLSRAQTSAVMIDPLWTNANGIDLNVGESVNDEVRNNFGFFGDGVLQGDPDSANMVLEPVLLPSFNSTAPAAYPFYGQVHPVLPSELRIRRLSLTNGASNPAASALMTPTLARNLFQSTDALNFSKFDADKVDPVTGDPLGRQPFQIFDRDATGNILRRQSTGGRLSQAMFIIPGAGQVSGIYRRVTLVFSARDFTLYSNPGGGRPANQVAFEDPNNDNNVNPRALMASAMVDKRIVPATSQYPEGVVTSGSEIVLSKVVWPGGGVSPTPIQTFLPVVGTPDAPGVRRDDWVMMINQLPGTSSPQIQFYRVANIDEGNDGTNGNPIALASLTLDGPAFEHTSPQAAYPANPTYIVHLRDVVSVFEDAISL